MTSIEKEQIAGFLDLTNDYLNSGYQTIHQVYNFSDDSCSQQNTENPENTDSLEIISEEIKKCRNCPLGNSRKNAVPGEGVRNPLLMVIGEGPGADEDAQGRPFVGKAGQLLDEMLKAIKMSRTTNCFIANVVKCRPPNNGDPKPEETAACSFFLARQIALLNPKMILLVGNIASQTILKVKEPVGRIHGKFYEYKSGDLTIPLIVTYHPAALLRNIEYKRPAWEDLKILQARIDSIVLN